MNFKEIILNQTIPRDLSVIKSFATGLKLSMFFGYFFTLGALCLVYITVFKLQKYLAGTFFILVAIGSFILLRSVYTEIALRKDIFKNGNIISAKVIVHGRKFNVFKSERDYTLTLLPKNSDTPLLIVSGNKSILKNCPKNSWITGLKLHDFYLFGEEIDYSFNVVSKQ